MLARYIDWRRLLVVMRPETLVRWHRQGVRLFWRRKVAATGCREFLGICPDLIAEIARRILGGLHHEYLYEPVAA